MRASEAIEYTRILVGDPDGDIHTDSKMLLHVNRVCRDISIRSRSIVEGHYFPASSLQSRYGLPEGFLRAEIVAWKFGDRYRPLDPITMEVASWMVHNQNTGRPRFYDIFGRAAIERAVEHVVQVGALPPQGNVVDAVVLAGGVREGLKPGDRIVNVSDASSVGRLRYAQNILHADNSITQAIGYSELVGGTRPYLELGDQVRILSPGSPRQSLIVAPVPVDVGDVGDEALFMFIARAHRQVTAGDINEDNDDLELDLEFESAMIEYICYYMRRDELGASDSETQSQFVTANGLYREALPKVQDRIRQWQVRWHQRQQVSARQYRIERDPVAQYAVGGTPNTRPTPPVEPPVTPPVTPPDEVPLEPAVDVEALAQRAFDKGGALLAQRNVQILFPPVLELMRGDKFQSYVADASNIDTLFTEAQLRDGRFDELLPDADPLFASYVAAHEPLETFFKTDEMKAVLQSPGALRSLAALISGGD